MTKNEKEELKKYLLPERLDKPIIYRYDYGWTKPRDKGNRKPVPKYIRENKNLYYQKIEEDAELGIVEAQSDLGFYERSNVGLSKAYGANYWLIRAANNGHPTSIKQIYDFLSLGKRGFKKNPELANTLLKILIERYYSNYLTDFEVCNNNRISLDKDIFNKAYGIDNTINKEFSGSTVNILYRLNLEANKRSLNCAKNKKFYKVSYRVAANIASNISKKLKITTSVFASKPKNIDSSISSNELTKEKQKRIALQKKADEEERKRKALEQRIAELEKKNKELQKPKQIKQKSSNEIGSGFYVSNLRHVVTNQHVVNKCKKITVGYNNSSQIKADLVASDKRNDLAILQTSSMEMASAEEKSFLQKLRMVMPNFVSKGLMRLEDVSGGEEIFVAGFPLGTSISDQMKLDDGIVRATKGMDNDVTQFIISSDIQKGNSGGPIYDKTGNIVGMAVSRFVNKNDKINFAIKGSTIKQFLSANDIPTKWANKKEEMDTKDIYQLALKQTVMVVCHN